MTKLFLNVLKSWFILFGIMEFCIRICYSKKYGNVGKFQNYFKLAFAPRGAKELRENQHMESEKQA